MSADDKVVDALQEYFRVVNEILSRNEAYIKLVDKALAKLNKRINKLEPKEDK